ncbi:MAG: MBL fold metallo-hydrolase [Deltaproteobacteria bacterium]|nr:MBL fold metallo-hydrolase [Deltaproteobacteria bacterium]
MQIGPYQIQTIEAGVFALDGGAMFGIVPRPLWEKKITPDARHRIEMRTRCLLVRGAVAGRQKVILIDTGMGTKWDAKGIDIYRVETAQFDLLRGLQDTGVAPEQVTDVILTHLHFDHAGGATRRAANGGIVPTFPRATYYVQQSHLDWSGRPTEKDRGSFMPPDFEPLLAAKQLVALDGPTELFPGIALRLSQGHTTGLQHPLISDGQTTLFYCADLIPTSLHVPVPWVMAYDIRPLVTIAEKQTILAEAVANGWILVFEHCPLIGTGTIIKTEKGYALGNAVAC